MKGKSIMHKAARATAMLLLLLTICTSAKALTVVASRAVLITPGVDRPLWSKSSATRHPPASITKVLTAILVIESGKLDDMVTISQRAIAAGGSSLYAQAGEKYSMRDLLYAALLISANDACAAMAEHLGGSIEGFAQMMNDRAREIGLQNSQFKNPHGMPESGHYSTAEDLALLGVHASKLPLFMEVSGTQRYTLQNGRVLGNQNKLLASYEGVAAGKTGYTDDAGQCLLIIAERDGLTLVSVVLGSQGQNLWSDTRALLDFGFSNYRRQTIVHNKQTLGVTKVPLSGEVLIVAADGFARTIPRTESGDTTTEIMLHKRLYPPLKPGDEIGEAIFRSDGKEIGRVSVTVPVYVPLVTTTRIIGILCIAVLGGTVAIARRWKR